MGALLSIPLAGGLTTIGSSCLAGLAFCFTSTAGSLKVNNSDLRSAANHSTQHQCSASHVIVTRLSQRVLVSLYISSCTHVYITLTYKITVYFSLQLHACMGHAFAFCHKPDWEVELWLYQDGLWRRKMLWGLGCMPLHQSKFSKLSKTLFYRFTVFVLLFPYSMCYSELPLSEWKILGTKGLLYRMGTSYLLLSFKCLSIF